jgi:hypothetical protein
MVGVVVLLGLELGIDLLVLAASLNPLDAIHFLRVPGESRLELL